MSTIVADPWIITTWGKRGGYHVGIWRPTMLPALSRLPRTMLAYIQNPSQVVVDSRSHGDCVLGRDLSDRKCPSQRQKYNFGLRWWSNLEVAQVSKYGVWGRLWPSENLQHIANRTCLRILNHTVLLFCTRSTRSFTNSTWYVWLGTSWFEV